MFFCFLCSARAAARAYVRVCRFVGVYVSVHVCVSVFAELTHGIHKHTATHTYIKTAANFHRLTPKSQPYSKHKSATAEKQIRLDKITKQNWKLDENMS